MSGSHTAILRDLVAFPTVSSESNLDLLAYIEQRLRPVGFETKRIPHRDRPGEKTNLLAWIGPDTPGGVMLAGHTDVVPVEGQSWKTDPFELAERDGRLVGRGSADMKGFLALVLAVCERLDLTHLKRRLWLSFTYDEEVGCLGVRELLSEVSSFGAAPRMVWIGEPTGGAVAVAHKGIGIYRTRVVGKPAHSSRPDMGTNAIEHAMRIFSDMKAILPDERDNRFTPPACTSNVGVIRGGSATNIVAEHCEIDWEVRPLPGSNVQEIARRFSARAQEMRGPDAPSVETHARAEVPALVGDRNQAASHEICSLLDQTTTTTAPFVTEGGLYEQAGLISVVCGPGELAQAHQPDESVCVAAMDRFDTVLANLVRKEMEERVYG